MKKLLALLIVIAFFGCANLSQTKGPPTGPSLLKLNAGNIEPINSAWGLSWPGIVAMGSAAFTVIAHGTPALDATEIFSPGSSSITVANNFVLDFANWPASGFEGKIIVYVTNGGAATITWDGSIIWSGGSPPSLTAAGRDVLVFTTIDGGTTVYGFVSGLDVK